MDRTQQTNDSRYHPYKRPARNALPLEEDDTYSAYEASSAHNGAIPAIFAGIAAPTDAEVAPNAFTDPNARRRKTPGGVYVDDGVNDPIHAPAASIENRKYVTPYSRLPEPPITPLSLATPTPTARSSQPSDETTPLSQNNQTLQTIYDATPRKKQRQEKQPIHEPYKEFSGLFSNFDEVRQHLYGDRKTEKEPEDVSAMSKNIRPYVTRLYNAMIDLSEIEDTVGDKGDRRTVSPAYQAWAMYRPYAPEDIEAKAYEVVIQIMKHHKFGCQLPEYQLRHVEEQGGEEDLPLIERFEIIEDGCRRWKSICDDIMKDIFHVRVLVTAPCGYIQSDQNKGRYRKSNKQRGDMTKTLKEGTANVDVSQQRRSKNYRNDVSSNLDSTKATQDRQSHTPQPTPQIQQFAVPQRRGTSMDYRGGAIQQLQNPSQDESLVHCSEQSFVNAANIQSQNGNFNAALSAASSGPYMLAGHNHRFDEDPHRLGGQLVPDQSRNPYPSFQGHQMHQGNTDFSNLSGYVQMPQSTSVAASANRHGNGPSLPGDMVPRPVRPEQAILREAHYKARHPGQQQVQRKLLPNQYYKAPSHPGQALAANGLQPGMMQEGSGKVSSDSLSNGTSTIGSVALPAGSIPPSIGLAATPNMPENRPSLPEDIMPRPPQQVQAILREAHYQARHPGQRQAQNETLRSQPSKATSDSTPSPAANVPQPDMMQAGMIQGGPENTNRNALSNGAPMVDTALPAGSTLSTSEALAKIDQRDQHASEGSPLANGVQDSQEVDEQLHSSAAQEFDNASDIAVLQASSITPPAGSVSLGSLGHGNAQASVPSTANQISYTNAGIPPTPDTLDTQDMSEDNLTAIRAFLNSGIDPSVQGAADATPQSVNSYVDWDSMTGAMGEESPVDSGVNQNLIPTSAQEVGLNDQQAPEFGGQQLLDPILAAQSSGPAEASTGPSGSGSIATGGSIPTAGSNLQQNLLALDECSDDWWTEEAANRVWNGQGS
ncbi:hypothetical protein NA57DRAFT_52589 [Rhizodiscina lignyota]|uniref:Uncharacterized protein n=1 Tax=Rhizodiscina lignyota TaxID=1504668 RepID=A0A9P4IR94_9PEZI|nr:hypothetical protein NA57DRAFT_52589 [Rhizodiscina lignyota]